MVLGTTTSPTLTWQPTLPVWPPLPWWALMLLFAGGFALVAYMYMAQRKVASSRAVAVLAGLRILLLVLLLVLLLRPSLTWTHTATSAGTLYLVLDQSPSMGAVDPQSTAVERLRWADAMGALPRELPRESRLDVVAAQVGILRDALEGMRSTDGEMLAAARGGAEGAGDQAAAKAFAEELEAWADRLDALAEKAGEDAGGGVATGGLERVSGVIRGAAREARGSKSLREAEGKMPWSMVMTNLDLSRRDMLVEALQRDEAYLARHGGDSGVQAALGTLDRMTRADLAYTALTQANGRTEKSFPEVLPKYRTKVVSFADAAQLIPALDHQRVEDTLRTALAPAGNATSIAAALRLVGETAGPDEAAAVVVLTDGRQNLPADATEPARLLAARGIPVYGVMIGSGQVSPDAAVEQTDAPEWIYKDDTLQAAAMVRLDGLPGKRLGVEFVRDGQVIGRQSVTARSGQDVQRVTFTDKPPGVAAFEYGIRVEQAPAEVNFQNNSQSFRVAVKKDKLAALYIENRPRWEYQYLRNYLARDNRLKVQTVLLSPAQIPGVAGPAKVKASVDNPRMEAEILPETREEWQAFDLIILGDVPPEALTVAQQQMIGAAVRDKGSTLITIAGAMHMPGRYEASPLADLLPVEMAGAWNAAELSGHLRGGFRPAPAPEGAASVLGQLGPDAAANAALWSRMPVWFWHSEYTRVKPAASALWVIAEPVGAQGSADVAKLSVARSRALLASMNVGLGRSLYLASDQTWRLRQVEGENLQDRFWGQVVRWAVGSDLAAGGRFVRFGTSRPRYAQGDPVTVTARVLREDLTPYSGVQVEVVARAVDKEGKAGAVVDTAAMRESPEAPGYYRATFGGLPAGNLELTLRGPEVDRLLDDDPTVTSRSLLVQITPQLDVERRNMNTDRAALARITAAGGGSMVEGPYADALASMLPEVRQTRRSTEQVGFFASAENRLTHVLHWVFLLVFAGVITAEWLVRKRSGMV